MEHGLGSTKFCPGHGQGRLGRPPHHQRPAKCVSEPDPGPCERNCAFRRSVGTEERFPRRRLLFDRWQPREGLFNLRESVVEVPMGRLQYDECGPVRSSKCPEQPIHRKQLRCLWQATGRCEGNAVLSAIRLLDIYQTKTTPRITHRFTLPGSSRCFIPITYSN